MILAAAVFCLAVPFGHLTVVSEALLQKLGLTNGSVILLRNSPPSSSDSIEPPKLSTTTRQPGFRIGQDFASLPIFINADRVSKMLRNFANEEMATYFLQTRFDHIAYQVDTGSSTAEVDSLARLLAEKIGGCKDAVKFLRESILSFYLKSPYDMRSFKQYHECCSIDPHYLKHSSHYGAPINSSTGCDVVPRGLSAFTFYPGLNLTNVFRLNVQRHPIIGKQFFISSDGLRSEYPAGRLDLDNYTNCELLALKQRREMFASIMFPYQKQLVVVIDRGFGASAKLFQTVKCVSAALLSSVGEQDEISMFAVSSRLLMPSNLYCLNGTVSATAETKDHLEQFIEALTVDSESTNHELAINTSLSIFENVPNKDSKQRRMLFYISASGGLGAGVGPLEDGRWSKSAGRVGSAVRIFNLAITDGDRAASPIHHRSAAAASEQRFAESVTTVAINASDTAECLTLHSLMQMFEVEQTRSMVEVRLSIVEDPYSRHFAFLLVSSLVVTKDQLIGVVGLEVELSDLVAPVIFYSDGSVTSYAFMLETGGNVVVHPHYVKLPSVRPLLVPVGMVEKRFPFVEWMHSLHQGHVSGQVLQLAGGDLNRTDLDVIYYWKKVPNTDYVVVIATRDKVSLERPIRHDQQTGLMSKSLAYHRLDLMLNKDVELCFQGRMLASVDRLGLYLAPRCFQNSTKRFTSAESKRTAQGFWAFVSDKTNLITNPGLKVNIRREIMALIEIASEWRRLAREGEFQNCVLRRYLATVSGVMVTLPAVLIHQHFDPVQRDWFQLAVQYPGKVAITGPMIDPSGFGHIVSLSHTVYEGKSAAVHHASDPVVAVLSIDVPVTFLYKMLHMHVSVCREPDVQCFLFDDRGYIVAYANMQQQQQGDVIKRPEGLHITHKEPLIASELLQRQDLVRKVICTRFSDRTVQRVYQFNTSFTDVVQNNDGCLRYQITSVRQTNVFLAIVNRSCHRQAAFCPCSVTDRRCLNCYRSEATECECPCECPPLYSHCPRPDGKPTAAPRNQLPPVCQAAADDPLFAQPDGHFADRAAMLPQCADISCSTYKSQIACLGVVGCEWCHVDFDRIMPLQQPYCASVHFCFSGILGLSPFGNIDQEILNSKFASSTPVGPVAGGIMGIFVLLVAGVYWYRQQVNRIMQSRCYGANDSSAIHLNTELEEEFHFDDGSSNNNNNTAPQTSGLLLASFERQNLVAMPRTRNRWRPGSRAESSDPGYSTMTANCEDSEATTVVDIVAPAFLGTAAGTKIKNTTVETDFNEPVGTAEISSL